VVPVHGVFEGVALWGQLLFLFRLTGDEICFTDRGQHFEFLPHFEDMASQTLPTFLKFFAKSSRRPGVKKTRDKIDLYTELSWEMSSNSMFDHNQKVGRGVEGL